MAGLFRIFEFVVPPSRRENSSKKEAERIKKNYDVKLMENIWPENVNHFRNEELDERHFSFSRFYGQQVFKVIKGFWRIYVRISFIARENSDFLKNFFVIRFFSLTLIREKGHSTNKCSYKVEYFYFLN